jgi:hypothetical protein
MVEVVLPTGELVSAGWYPEGAINGEYKILATHGFSCLLEASTTDVYEALRNVEQFTQRLSSPAINLSSSTNHNEMVYA